MKTKKTMNYKIEPDKFNSQIFGINMGNIVLISKQISEEELKNIRLQKTYEHLSVKIPTCDKYLLNQFLKEGFCLVDTQVMYKLDIGPKNKILSSYVRKATVDDLFEVMNISKTSFTIDRFHSDINLNYQLANDYYATWTKNLILDKTFLTYVYEENGKIFGFSSWKINNNDALLILVAVLKGFRGKGIYKAMLTHFFYCHGNEFISAKTGTQINNYPVHKFWGKAGAYLVESKYVLHKKV